MHSNSFILYIHHATQIPHRDGISVLTVQVVDGEISIGQEGQILLGQNQFQQIIIQSIGIIDPYDSSRDSTFRMLPLTIAKIPETASIEHLAGHFCVETPAGVCETAFETILELNNSETLDCKMKGIPGKIGLNHHEYPGIFLFNGSQKRAKHHHGTVKLLLNPPISIKAGTRFHVVQAGQEIGQGVIMNESHNVKTNENTKG
jgi:hypothetical protein